MFYETEEDGDDETGLECLAEDDDEDGDREETWGHDGRREREREGDGLYLIIFNPTWSDVRHIR